MRCHSLNSINYSAPKILGAQLTAYSLTARQKIVILKNEKETERRDGRKSGRRTWRKIMTRGEKNRKRRKIRRVFKIAAFNF